MDSAALYELATGVVLSESRLAHLFRRDVGLLRRRYRLAGAPEQRATQAAREGRQQVGDAIGPEGEQSGDSHG